MTNYLSQNRMLLLSSPRIRSFHGKSILIVDGESEYQSRLAVSYDQPGNPESDSCCVSAQQAFEDEARWATPLPDTMPPPSKAHYRKQYLSQMAVDLIRDPADEHHGEFVLVLPQE